MIILSIAIACSICRASVAVLEIKSINCAASDVSPDTTSKTLGEICENEASVDFSQNTEDLDEIIQQKLSFVLSGVGPLLPSDELLWKSPHIFPQGSQVINKEANNSSVSIKDQVVKFPSICGRFALVAILSVVGASGKLSSHKAITLRKLCEDDELDLALYIEGNSNGKASAKNGQFLKTEGIDVYLVNVGSVNLSARTVTDAIDIYPVYFRENSCYYCSNYYDSCSNNATSCLQYKSDKIFSYYSNLNMKRGMPLMGLETIFVTNLKELEPGGRIKVDLSAIKFPTNGFSCYLYDYFSCSEYSYYSSSYCESYLALFLDPYQKILNSNRNSMRIAMKLNYEISSNSNAEFSNICSVLPDVKDDGKNAAIFRMESANHCSGYYYIYKFNGETKSFKSLSSTERESTQKLVEHSRLVNRLLQAGLCQNPSIDDSFGQSLNISLIPELYKVVSQIKGKLEKTNLNGNKSIEEKLALSLVIDLYKETLKAFMGDSEEFRHFVLQIYLLSSGFADSNSSTGSNDYDTTWWSGNTPSYDYTSMWRETTPSPNNDEIWNDRTLSNNHSTMSDEITTTESYSNYNRSRSLRKEEMKNERSNYQKDKDEVSKYEEFYERVSKKIKQSFLKRNFNNKPDQKFGKISLKAYQIVGSKISSHNGWTMNLNVFIYKFLNGYFTSDNECSERKALITVLTKLYTAFAIISDLDELNGFEFIPTSILEILFKIVHNKDRFTRQYSFIYPWMDFVLQDTKDNMDTDYMNAYENVMTKIMYNPFPLKNLKTDIKNFLQYLKANLSVDVRSFHKSNEEMTNLIDFSLQLLDIFLESLDSIFSLVTRFIMTALLNDNEGNLLNQEPGREPNSVSNCERAARHTQLLLSSNQETKDNSTEGPYFNFLNIYEKSIRMKPYHWMSYKGGIYRGQRSSLLGVMYWEKIAQCYCVNDYYYRSKSNADEQTSKRGMHLQDEFEKDSSFDSFGNSNKKGRGFSGKDRNFMQPTALSDNNIHGSDLIQILEGAFNLGEFPYQKSEENLEENPSQKSFPVPEEFPNHESNNMFSPDQQHKMNLERKAGGWLSKFLPQIVPNFDTRNKSPKEDSSIVRLSSHESKVNATHIEVSGMLVIELVKAIGPLRSRVFGTVCDRNFGVLEATVACNQLAVGFNITLIKAIPIRGETKKISLFDSLDLHSLVTPLMLDNVRCTEAAEDLVADCEHDLWGKHSCKSYQRAEVRCVFEIA